jgi:hypothetical protein
MQLNVFQRLNLIKEEISYVQKDKAVSTGGGSYRAVTHDQVTAHTRALFVKHGVAVVPDEAVSATVVTTMLTGKGLPIIRFEATYVVSFISIDDPASKVSMTVTAHALDQGDKAPGKALSYATKYAVLKVLQLETGEEEESRMATEPPVPTVDMDKHQKAIDEAPDLDGLQVIWKQIIADCNAAKDTAAYNNLKNEVTHRKAKLTPKKETP